MITICVKRAHKHRGQRLIVSDLREHEMAKRADIFLCLKPGTDLAWLLAVSRYLLENGLAHTEFLRQWMKGLDEYKERLAPFTMGWAARTCGISEDTLKKVAHLIAESNSVSILWANWQAPLSQWAPASIFRFSGIISNSMDKLLCVLPRLALAMPGLNPIRKRTSRSATSRPAKLQTTSWRSAWTLAEPGITHALVGARGGRPGHRRTPGRPLCHWRTDVRQVNELARAGALLGPEKGR